MRAVSARESLPKIVLLWTLLFSATYLLSGCNSYSLGNLSTAAAISASSTSVRVNQTLQLTSQALSGGLALKFSVNGVPGGNAEFGTISNSGLYTAPAVIPSPDSVTITSTSVQYPTAPQGSVSLQIWNPIPVLNSVTPTGFSEGSTQVTVTGSQFVYGAQINWNGTLVPTTYISSTQLVAQIAAPNPGTFPLLVTNPNPGSANSSSLSLLVGPGKVVLQVETNGGFDVRVSNSITFGLTVNGTSNTGVTLQVNGVPGGNATVGTVVANKDGSITYTAPAVVPTASTVVPGHPNVVQITITSVDDPTVAIGQNVAVLNPIPILTAANPMSFSPGTSTQITLTGSNFINGAQVLVNGTPASATSFNSGIQLTATVDISQPGNLDLQVLNPAPGPATSADLIAQVTGTPPTPMVSPADAARFLEQATFGPTDADIRTVSLNGIDAWLNQQFAMPAPTTPAWQDVETSLIIDNPPCASSDVKCNAGIFLQNDQNEAIVQDAFWQQSLAANDELRQRVKYALLQQFVISSNNTSSIQDMPRGEMNYYDMLGKDAFPTPGTPATPGNPGNFRTLLEDITLNPMMGQFLSMLGNDKGNATTDPDENYAREVMQLFTIGLWQLNDDGTQKLDASGNPIPTYSNLDVMGLAKVFTGFSWNVPGDTSDTAWSNCCIYVGPGIGEDLLPMQSYPTHHSTAEKDFLGVTIAAGSSDPNGDLKIALDTLFNHPNVPAFFSKQMIQHLVTSNPSPAYVTRIAQVFKNDGTGVRGNLKAVINAILTDPEARDTATATTNPEYGKVKEPLLRYSEWARAFTAQSRNGAYNVTSTEDPIYGFGEMWMRSPTVFNWFSPGYFPPNTSISSAGLLAPEMQIVNVSSVVGYINYMQNAVGSGATSGPDIFSSYATEMSLAPTPDQLVNRINLLLMAGQMSTTLQNQIGEAVNSIPIPASDQNAINAALLSRVKTAVYLTIASPDFAAQE
ncbi:MAG TPA: DUF1800 family protein [Terracidiphilus sp.]|nr:DUF1800 family protein [Terracidiphilus sp.]